MRVPFYSETFLQQAVEWLPRAAAAVLILAAFWLLEKIARRAIARLKRHSLVKDQVFTLLTGVSEGGLFIVGILTALGTLGIDVSAIVAGLGLAGFAVGFALKDIISNIVAGVRLLVYRPFVEGEWIGVAGGEGQVDCITLRYTRLAAAEHNKEVMIPNASLFTNPIVVFRGGKQARA